MIVADILLIGISLISLLFASITDIKIKEVPDWLSYGLISSALIIRLLHSIIFSQYSYFLYGILGLISMFIIGEILYHLKLWGGGDAKLLMGLGTSLATTPFYLESAKLPFLLSLFIFILFAGALYGISWSIYLTFKDFKKFKEEFIKIRHSHSSKIIKTLSIIIIVLSALGLLLLPLPNVIRLIIAAAIVLFLFYPYLFMAVKAIENIHLYTYLPIEKIVEGDWIAKDVKKDDKIVFSKKSTITKKDIKRLKELNIKKVLVKDGIPFVPPFLVGTILALIMGSLI